MACRRTPYVVTDPEAAMVLKVEQPNQAAAVQLQAHGLRSALFVSAHNPRGTCLSAEENQRRHTELLQALQPRPLLEVLPLRRGADEARDVVVRPLQSSHTQRDTPA